MKKFIQFIYIWGILLTSSATQFINAQLPLNPRSQPQFVNPLPIPSVIDGRNGGIFTIGVSQFDQWLGLINPINGEPLQTTVWGTMVLTPDLPFWQRKMYPFVFSGAIIW